MDTHATDRLGVRRAPGGLSLVQEFLNTAVNGQVDLLADAESARGWFEPALVAWSAQAGLATPPVALDGGDRDKLITVRADLRRAVGGWPRDPTAHPGGWMIARGVSAALRQGVDGTVRAAPQGRGWKLVASLLLIEALAAQAEGQWPRLKVCRNHACAVAFYDRSRNNSGVWHDVLTCGNAANLRVSRARRKAQPDAG